MTRKQEGKPFSIATENHGDVSVNFRHRALREPRLQIGIPQGGETVFFNVNTTRGRAVSFRQQEILRELQTVVGQRLDQQEQGESGSTPTQSLVLANKLLGDNLGRLDQVAA